VVRKHLHILESGGASGQLNEVHLSIGTLKKVLKKNPYRNGLKRKIQQFVAYRRPISPTEISIG
jgi:hypothetical protein